MQLNISRITVLISPNSTDTIYLTPEAETPFPVMGYPANLKLEAQAGYGVEWVRKTFGREPDEVIDLLNKTWSEICPDCKRPHSVRDECICE